MEATVKMYDNKDVGKMTPAQIKKKVGEAWAILENPVYENGILQSAELLYYNADKAKALEQLSKCKNGHFAFRFFGTIDTKQIYIL